MPNWTSQATVKKHLIVTSVFASQIENERVLLQGAIDYQLSSKSLSNITVKAVENISITIDPKRLTGTTEISLSHEQIVPGTICVADVNTLDTIYTEGVDYYINYVDGKIARIGSGSIGDGDTPQIYYLYFHVFTLTVDYLTDPSAGTISRVILGSIEQYQPLFIDFTTTAGSIDNDLIDQAILEAEDIIEQQLSSEYSIASTDQGLKTGSTWIALSIISRSKACEVMLKDPSDNTDGAAKSWLEIMKMFEDRANRVLSRFYSSTALRSISTKKTIPT